MSDDNGCQFEEEGVCKISGSICMSPSNCGLCKKKTKKEKGEKGKGKEKTEKTIKMNSDPKSSSENVKFLEIQRESTTHP